MAGAFTSATLMSDPTPTPTPNPTPNLTPTPTPTPTRTPNQARYDPAQNDSRTATSQDVLHRGSGGGSLGRGSLGGAMAKVYVNALSRMAGFEGVPRKGRR